MSSLLPSIRGFWIRWSDSVGCVWTGRRGWVQPPWEPGIRKYWRCCTPGLESIEYLLGGDIIIQLLQESRINVLEQPDYSVMVKAIYQTSESAKMLAESKQMPRPYMRRRHCLVGSSDWDYRSDIRALDFALGYELTFRSMHNIHKNEAKLLLSSNSIRPRAVSVSTFELAWQEHSSYGVWRWKMWQSWSLR